jgi:hypothetical protein
MAFSSSTSSRKANKPSQRAIKSLGRPGNDQAHRSLLLSDVFAGQKQGERNEQEICEEEDDRLSTAAPSSVSPCEVTRRRWADMEDSDHETSTADLRSFQPSRARWSDLVDSDESSQKHTSAFEGSRQHWHATRHCSWKHEASRANEVQGHHQVTRDQMQRHGNKTKDSSHLQAPTHSSQMNTYVIGAKLQCQFLIGIEEEPTFRVCRKLLGPQGQFMKEIAARTGSKLRLRGRGSKFLEGPEQRESTDPLMLCISSPTLPSYAETKKLVLNLLESVYEQYRAFSKGEGSGEQTLSIKMHEGPRAGSF